MAVNRQGRGTTLPTAPGESEATLPEDERATRASGGSREEALFLVLAACREEPWRAGEASFLPPEATRVFGRGPAHPDDGHPRLELCQYRPGRVTPTGTPQNQRLSRRQLIVRAAGCEYLEIRNVGRCALFYAGQEVTSCRVTPGEALLIGDQLCLLCVRRPAWLGNTSESWPAFAFGTPDPFGFVGEAPVVWQLRQTVAFTAARSGHVIIFGASGTGKELVARALHALSDRRHVQLVSRNAATFPDSLIDAELFGTAAHFPNHGMPERPGLIGSADGSCLFLDEFSELAPVLQAHLLRVLDAGEYQRLGESRIRHSDFKLIAATNRDPSAIRPDLLARFAFRIEVPDLNARREDIPLLLRSMAQTIGDRGPEQPLALNFVKSLVEHRYASNVRELERMLWAGIADASNLLFQPGSAQRFSVEAEATRVTDESDAAPPAILSRERIQACLDEHNGRLEHTWRALGLKNRYALRRYITKYGLEVRRTAKRRS